VTGPTGITGSQGTNGPTGSVFNSDSTILAPGATIPATDTFSFYLVNNSGGPATITLPPANVEGKRLLIYVQLVQCINTPGGGEPGNCSSHTVTPQLHLQGQGGDLIFDQSNALVTTGNFIRFAELISHSGIWYLGAGY